MFIKTLATLLIFCLAPLAWASNFDYRVEINGLGDQGEKWLPTLDIEAWHDSEEMNFDQLERLHRQAPEQLQNLLATEGYFNATITPSLEQDNETWVARYNITPGPVAVVSEVAIQFEGELKEDNQANEQRRKNLNQLWPLPLGSQFKQTPWREGKKRLLENLNNEDYPYASLKHSSANVAEDGLSIRLSLILDSGPKIQMGELKISGLEKYPTKTIRNLNTIAPGSAYKREALLKLQTSLIESGYFSGVLVQLPPQDEIKGKVADLLVQVTELKLQQIRIGLGYSTDSKERMQLGYEHRNILGRGWRWNARIQLDRVNQSISNEITFPSDKKRHQDSVGHSLEHADLGSNIGETYTNRLYGKRHWGTSALERTLSLELIDEARKTIINNPPSPRTSRKNEIVTTNLGYAWVERAVDDLVFPTTGHVLEMQALIGTQFKINPYYRFYGRFNRYIPINNKFQFLSRIELGQIFGSPEEPPSDYLFLAGGDNSIRGYPFHSLGHPNGSSTLGSPTTGIFSAEMQYWFKPNWGGAVFFDTGSLGPQLLRSTWYQGYGAGIRWRSPVGPLNLDYAWGRKVKDYQIHFSIGLAF